MMFNIQGLRKYNVSQPGDPVVRHWEIVGGVQFVPLVRMKGRVQVADLEALLLPGQVGLRAVTMNGEVVAELQVSVGRRLAWTTAARRTRWTSSSPSWPSCSNALPILRTTGLRSSPREGIHRWPKAEYKCSAWDSGWCLPTSHDQLGWSLGDDEDGLGVFDDFLEGLFIASSRSA